MSLKIFESYEAQMSEPSDVATDVGKGFWARMDHPIFGAFIGSWLICNWEIPYLLICGIKNPEVTIAEINGGYLTCSCWITLVLLPLLLTGVFLFSAPYLHDKYVWFKKWVLMKVMETEPIPKDVYLKQRAEYKALQNEKYIIDAAYNLVRDKQIRVPGAPEGYGKDFKLDAKSLIDQYFSNERRMQDALAESTQLKANLLEAEKRISELENTK